jgi:hypothetical protein
LGCVIVYIVGFLELFDWDVTEKVQNLAEQAFQHGVEVEILR